MRESITKNRVRHHGRLGAKCGATGKVIFKSHEAALTRAGEILEDGARDTQAFRSYRCEYCGFWHLSKTV